MTSNTTGLKPGGNRRGRPKGALNKVTAEVRLAAAEMVDNPSYRCALMKRLLAGELAPAMETMLWAYAKGKPKETVVVDGSFSVRWLGDEDDEPTGAQ